MTTQARRQVHALPNGWWGFLLLIGTEATVFGSIIGAYFFLRVSSDDWPMGGIEPPDALVPSVLTGVLVLTSVPMFGAASAALRGRARAAWLLTLLALVVQMGYLAMQVHLYLDDLNTFPPSANAYASIYYTLLGLHHAHVLVGIVLGWWVVGRLVLGGLNGYRVTTVRGVALYWHFVNVMAILVLFTELTPVL